MFAQWKKEMIPYYSEDLIDLIAEINKDDRSRLDFEQELSDGAKEYLLNNFRIDLKKTPFAIATLIWGYRKNVLGESDVSYSEICSRANSYNLDALRLLYANKEFETFISPMMQGISSLVSSSKMQEASQEIERSTHGKLKIEVDSAPEKSILNQIIFSFGVPIFVALGENPSDELCYRAKEIYDEMINVETNATALISAILNDTDLEAPLSEFFDNLREVIYSKYDGIENLDAICEAFKDGYRKYYAISRNPFLFFKDYYKESITIEDKKRCAEINEEKYARDPKYASAVRKDIDKIIDQKVYGILQSVFLKLIKIQEGNRDIPEINYLYNNTIVTKFALKLLEKKYFFQESSIEIYSQADTEMQLLLKALHHITLCLKGSELHDLQENIDRLKKGFEEIKDATQLTKKAEEYRALNLPKKIESLAALLLNIKKVFDKCDPDFQFVVNDVSVTGEEDLSLEIATYYLPFPQALEELAELSRQAVKLFVDKCCEIDDQQSAQAALESERENAQAILELKRHAEELAAQERESSESKCF